MAKQFRVYEVDEEVTKLVIKEVKAATTAKRTTLYEVLCLYCNNTSILSHRRIRDRISDEATGCAQCRTTKQRSDIAKAAHNKKLADAIQEKKRSLRPGYHGWEPPPSCKTKRGGCRDE